MFNGLFDDAQLLPEIEEAIENLSDEEHQKFDELFPKNLENEYSSKMNSDKDWNDDEIWKVFERAIQKTLDEVEKDKKVDNWKNGLDLLW
jgi:hypothetical protein